MTNNPNETWQEKMLRLRGLGPNRNKKELWVPWARQAGEEGASTYLQPATGPGENDRPPEFWNDYFSKNLLAPNEQDYVKQFDRWSNYQGKLQQSIASYTMARYHGQPDMQGKLSRTMDTYAKNTPQLYPEGKYPKEDLPAAFTMPAGYNGKIGGGVTVLGNENPDDVSSVIDAKAVQALKDAGLYDEFNLNFKQGNLTEEKAQAIIGKGQGGGAETGGGELQPNKGIPEGYVGGPQGPNGEPLPEGAYSFDANGEPVYKNPEFGKTPEERQKALKGIAEVATPNISIPLKFAMGLWEILPPQWKEYNYNVVFDLFNDIGSLNKKNQIILEHAPDKNKMLDAAQAGIQSVEQMEANKKNFGLVEGAWGTISGMWITAAEESSLAPVLRWMEVLGNDAMKLFTIPAEYMFERPIGTFARFFTGGKYSGVGSSEVPNLTIDEAYQLSKIGWSSDPVMQSLESGRKYLGDTFTGGKIRDKAMTDAGGNALAAGALLISQGILDVMDKNRKLQADMIRRLRDGENPDLLAIRFADPEAEFYGQFILDPLNFADVITKPLTLAMGDWRIAKATLLTGALDAYGDTRKANAVRGAIDIARKAASDSPELTKAIETIADGANDVLRGVRETQDAWRGKKTLVQGFGQKLLEFGGPNAKGPTKWISKIYALTSNAAMRRTLSSIDYVISSLAKGAKEVGAPNRAEYITQFIQAGMRFVAGPVSDSPEAMKAYTNAVQFIASSPHAELMLSEHGLHATSAFSSLLMDGGLYNRSGMGKILDILDEGFKTGSTMTKEKLMEEFTGLVSRMFPDVGTRLKYEDDIAEAVSKGGKAFDNLPQHIKYWAGKELSPFEKTMWKVLEKDKKLINKYLPFMSKFLIVDNPAQWTRNYVSNWLHVFFDTGAVGNPLRYEGDWEALVLRGTESLHTVQTQSSGLPDVLIKLGKNSGDPLKGLKPHERVEGVFSIMATRMGQDQEIRHAVESGAMFAADDLFEKSGASLDEIKHIKAEIAKGLNPNQVLDDFLGGRMERNLSALLNDKKLEDTLRGSGLWDEFVKINSRSDVTDATREAFINKVHDLAEKGRYIPSEVLKASMDAETEALITLPDGSKVDLGDAFEVDNKAFHSFRETAERTWDDIIKDARRKMSVNQNMPMYDQLDLLDTSIKKEVSNLRRQLMVVEGPTLRETYIKGDMTYVDYRTAMEDLFNQSAVKQYEVYKRGFGQMDGFDLGFTLDGMAVPPSEFYAKEWMEAENTYAWKRALESMTDEQFFQMGRTLRFGSGSKAIPNSVIDLFNKYQIPCAAQTLDGRYSPFSWAAIRKMLQKGGVELAIEDIATNKLTPELLKEVEKFCQAASEQGGFMKANRRGLPFDVLKNLDETIEVKRIKNRLKEIQDIEKGTANVDTLAEGTVVTAGQQAALGAEKRRLMQDIMKEAWIQKPTTTSATLPGLLEGMDDLDWTNAASEIENTLSWKVREAFGKIEADLPNRVAKGERVLTSDQMTAFNQWRKETTQRVTDLTPRIMAAGDHMRNFALLDYGDRRGFDTIMGLLMPYHYWYSRSIANWTKRLVSKPYIAAAYVKYRRMMSELHAGMPDYLKYQWNSNELFGLDWENPMYFNLEAMINPLNGITGIDFNDGERRDGWLESTIDDIGKFGPTLHMPIYWGMAAVKALQGKTDEARSWAGRSIPQTQFIKSFSAALGFDPFHTGGLELDPGMLLQGGIGKYEERRVGNILSEWIAEGKMMDGALVSPAAIADAGRSHSGPIWNAAVLEAAQRRSLGGIVGLFGGPAVKGRTANEIQMDRFYAEVSAMYAKQQTMDPLTRQTAWKALFEKYPQASVMLMSKKSGIERDEAFAYDVLGRIAPGELSDFAKAIGMDYKIVDEFYSKSLVGMNKQDQQRFMAAIADWGALLEIPDNATRHEWDSAKLIYATLMEGLAPSQADRDAVMASVDSYYDLVYTDQKMADEFLVKHPEVERYMNFRGQVVMSSDILMKYYGGVKFLEGYWRREMISNAEAIWPGIGKVAAAYNSLVQLKGDTEAFREDHPELEEYFKYLAAQKKVIATKVKEFGRLLPENTKSIWRKDAKAESINAYNFYKQMRENSPDVAYDSMLEPYLTDEGGGGSGGSQPAYTGLGDLDKWVMDQAEKKWPGIEDRYSEYNKRKSFSKKDGEQYLVANPDVLDFINWRKSIHKNADKLTNIPTDAPQAYEAWAEVQEDPAIARLMGNYRKTGEMTDQLRRYMTTVWEKAGRPYGSLEEWLNAMVIM